MCILVLPSAIAIRAIMAIKSHKWLLWHLWQQSWHCQYGHYGYPGKEHRKTNSAVLELNPFKSYDCLKSSCWSLECSLYYKTGRLGVKFTDTRNTWPRRKTKGVLDSDKEGEHFGRV